MTLEEVERADGVTIHFSDAIRLFDLRSALPSLRGRTSGIICVAQKTHKITISFTDST